MEGLADGVGRGGAGGGDGVGRALDAELHGDVAGAGVGHAERDGERVDAVAAMDVELAVADLFGGAAANAGAGDDGAVLAHGGCQLEAGLGHRLLRRDDGELREAVHQGDVFGGEVIFGDEALDVGGMFEADLLEVGRIDRADAAGAGDEGAPEGIAGEADRADDADAGDDDAGHVSFPGRPWHWPRPDA